MATLIKDPFIRLFCPLVGLLAGGSQESLAALTSGPPIMASQPNIMLRQPDLFKEEEKKEKHICFKDILGQGRLTK